MTTRRQHYVWQKYLEPWTVKDKKGRKIWCLRKDSRIPFLVDTKNVAVERDFYRLSKASEADMNFVRFLVFNRKTNQVLHSLNEGWIKGFELLFRAHKIVVSHPKTNHQARELLEKELIEHQEKAYAKMEAGAVSYLAALQRNDVSFFAAENHATQFSYFLAHQYFRTKAIRDRIRATFAGSDAECFDRVWPIMRYVFATNIGFAIFSERRAVQLQVLRAPPDIEFITSDQPAINTYGAFVSETTPVKEMEIFYPISPSRAAILSGHAAYQGMHGQELGPLRMSYLNQTVERVAYEQLFASSQDTLTKAAGTFCR